MNQDVEVRRKLRNQGVVWICFAPIAVTMALISTVSSGTTYYLQLIGFSAVAVAGLVCGIGALSYRPWAARGIAILSWTVVAYFIGAALLVLAWAFFGQRVSARFIGGSLVAVAGLLILALGGRQPVLSILALSMVASGGLAWLAIFWTLPTAFLSGTAAAGGIA